jgi:hypothetical protein
MTSIATPRFRADVSEHPHGQHRWQLVTEIMLGYEAKIAGLLVDAQAHGWRADLDVHAAATCISA